MNGHLKKLAAPVLLAAVILALELYRVKAGVFYTSAPIYPLVVFLTIANGAIAGFIGAGLAALYSIFVTDDPVRAAIVTVSYFGTVALVSYINRRQKEIDTVERLISKLWAIHSLLLSNLVNWPDMSDKEKWGMVELINTEIADIMTVVRGWHILAQERESLKKE